MRLASGNVKKISLELGGKSPNIVFADADLEKFARESPYTVFDNAGQDCCARSRILVERIGPRSGRRAVRRGDPQASRSAIPADDATEIGSLVSHKQRDRVQDYIEIGLGEGATLVVGGDAPDDPALAAGAYLMPTVFDGVDNDMRIAREEIFGPVVVDHPVRHGGGGAAPRQRHAVRPVRLDLEPRHRQGAARGQGPPGRASSASTRTARSTPRRRSAATRCRASAASSGWPRSTCTRRPRTSSSTSAEPASPAASAAIAAAGRRRWPLVGAVARRSGIVGAGGSLLGASAAPRDGPA